MNSTNFLANLTESMTEKAPEKFTVKRTPKIDKISKKEKEAATGKETSVGLAVIKWFATIFMFCLTLFSLVSSKVTLISIGQNMKPVNVSAEDIKSEGETHRSDIAFTMMVLILIIPNSISFVRALFSIFSSSEIWPSCKSVIYVSTKIIFFGKV